MKTTLLAALAGAAVLVSAASATAQASLADQLSTVRKMQAERKARRGPAQMQREILQALLFRELHDGSTKISLRSSGDADVAAVARRLGGGGHVKAAGAVIPEALEAAEVRVLDEVREALS